MKLHHSPASPFVRKVMACAIIRGIEGRIEKVASNPHLSPPELLVDNPLSKIPALVTDSGDALFDSAVICEYLDGLGDAPKLVPAAGAARIAALKLEALGDGLMDAAVARRGMQQLPQDEGRVAFDKRQAGVVTRTLAVLEGTDLSGAMDIGRVTVGCALGYLDFRFPQEPWRPTYPKLATWYAGVQKTRAFTETMPPV